MKAGELRNRVTIQQPTAMTNARGGKTKGWEDVKTVWAAIEPLSGREYFEAHQTEMEVTTRIRIRTTDGLNTHMRVKHGEQYFKIISILESDAQITLMTSETGDFA